MSDPIDRATENVNDVLNEIGAPPAEVPATFDEACGYSFDNDTVETYQGPDGTGWECRRCGAEGWEVADDVAR